LGEPKANLAVVGGPDSATVKPDERNVAHDGVGTIAAKESAKKTASVRKLAIPLKAGDDTSAYLIGAHDVLEITVFRVPELSKTIQVASEGTINFPLVGQVQAEGKTPKQVETALTSKLGAKYLRKPQITVYVKEFNSRRVTINGAIKKPGVFPIRGKMTLMSLVAMAQGVNENADSVVAVFRMKDGKRTAARYDIDAIKAGTSEDPALQPEDVVVVGTSAVKAVFNNFLKVVPVLRTFVLL